jgi:proline iminopeptidase
MGRVFPEQWERFASIGLQARSDRTNLVNLYSELVFNEDPALRERAAREWCAWEDAHVSLAPGFVPNARYQDPTFRLLFARLVTHYWKNAAFLREEQLIENVSLLNDIPGTLIHGRYDISSPLETAWRLHRDWRGSVLQIVDDSGHGGHSMSERIVEAITQIGL